MAINGNAVADMNTAMEVVDYTEGKVTSKGERLDDVLWLSDVDDIQDDDTSEDNCQTTVTVIIRNDRPQPVLDSAQIGTNCDGPKSRLNATDTSTEMRTVESDRQKVPEIGPRKGKKKRKNVSGAEKTEDVRLERH